MILNLRRNNTVSLISKELIISNQIIKLIETHKPTEKRKKLNIFMVLTKTRNTQDNILVTLIIG